MVVPTLHGGWHEGQRLVACPRETHARAVRDHRQPSENHEGCLLLQLLDVLPDRRWCIWQHIHIERLGPPRGNLHFDCNAALPVPAGHLPSTLASTEGAIALHDTLQNEHPTNATTHKLNQIRVNRYNPTSQFSDTHSETRQLVKRAYHNHRWLAWLHHC